MDQGIIQNLEKLVEEGKKLAPQGGNMGKGYNGKLQSEYVSWRMRSLSAIESLGKLAESLKKGIESDKSGPYFYQSSEHKEC